MLGSLPAELNLTLHASPVWTKVNKGTVKINQGILTSFPAASFEALVGHFKHVLPVVLVFNTEGAESLVAKFQSTLYRTLVPFGGLNVALLMLSNKALTIFPYLRMFAGTMHGTVVVSDDLVVQGWRPLTEEDIWWKPTVLLNVVAQLRELLEVGIGHCDVRLSNIFIKGDKSALIDLESLTSYATTSSRLEFIAVSGDGAFTHVRLAIWQVSVLLFTVSKQLAYDLNTFTQWLEKFKECKLLALALKVQEKPSFSPEASDFAHSAEQTLHMFEKTGHLRCRPGTLEQRVVKP